MPLTGTSDRRDTSRNEVAARDAPTTPRGRGAAAPISRRWAVYVRISQDRTGTALGVARQEKHCRILVAAKGGQVVRVYTDNDISASNGKRRPAYQGMLQAVRDELIDGVVVWNIDRLTRRPMELEEFVELAERYRIELATVSGEIDLGTTQGKLLARVLGAFAKAESDKISDRIRSKMEELREGGALTGGGRFFGWTNKCDNPDCEDVHKRLRIVAAEADLIVECCDRVLAGETLYGICRDLNIRGITTSRGRPWDRKTVRNMLVRGRNAGLVEARDKRDGVMKVVGKATAWEPIVSEEVWRSVCVILQDSSRRQHYTTNKVQNLLSHIAVCGVCGAPMIAGVAQVMVKGEDGQRSKGRVKIYKCRSGGSGHPARRKNPVDDLVVEAVLRRLELADIHDLLRPHLDEEHRDVEADIAVLEAQMEQHALMLADNVMTPAQFSTANCSSVSGGACSASLCACSARCACFSLGRQSGQLRARKGPLNGRRRRGDQASRRNSRQQRLPRSPAGSRAALARTGAGRSSSTPMGGLRGRGRRYRRAHPRGACEAMPRGLPSRPRVGGLGHAARIPQAGYRS